MENIQTLQQAANIVSPAVAQYRMTVSIVGKPDADTGTLRLTDRKGRHCATIIITGGVPASVTEVKLGQQNLCGSIAKMAIRNALGM